MNKYIITAMVLFIQLSSCSGQSTGYIGEINDTTATDTSQVDSLTPELAVDTPPPVPEPPPCLDVNLNQIIREICFQGKTYIAVVFTPRDYEVELFNKKPGGGTHTLESVAKLKADQKRPVIFAMNAGMYDKNSHPIGLYISNGKEEHPLNLKKKGYGNFYSLGHNGVFGIDDQGEPFLVKSTRYDTTLKDRNVVLATQSGPLMIINEVFNPKFNQGSPNLHIRNAVGVADDNQVVFAISEQPVNFYEFSEFLREKLGCRHALYLDGAISQWYASDIKKTAGPSVGPLPQVGPIITISRKP